MIVTVTISIAFEGGVLLDTPDKAGLAILTASMLNESTENFSNEDMANELAKLGSRVSVSAAGRFTTVMVSSLAKNLQDTLFLVEEKLFRPAFVEAEFDRLKSRLLEGMNQQRNSPSALASQATDQILFGLNNRISLPDSGTTSSVQAITLDDVKDFYAKYYTSGKASAVLVGNIERATALRQLEFLNKLENAPYDIPSYAPFPKYDTQSIYLVDKPDAVQSVVKLVVRDMPFDATGEYFLSQLMNFSLGAAFNSRINLNLREDKGITYGASTNFIGGKSVGWFEASSDIKWDSTALGISEMLREIRKFKDTGITPDELAFMRSAYTQSDALNFETPASKAAFLRILAAYNLDPAFRMEQLAIIEAISKLEIDALAKRRLRPDDLQIIVVGDAEKITAQLESLNVPIIELKLAQ